MKPAILAFLLSCTAAALAQIPAEKPVNENYTYNTAPRFRPCTIKPSDFVYEPSYKYIKPPLDDVKVASVNKTINNENGATLTYSSGTTIAIPPDAFVDENGNAVKGNVTVTYREYKNPLDFLLSGIPMGADSAGAKGQFISAGMFEINASVNGKKVFLKEGSKVNVQLSSVDKEPDYNLYAFNDATGSWDMKTDKSNVQTTVKPPFQYSPAISKYMNMLSYGNGLNAYDSTLFKDRFESSDYFYTQKSREQNISKVRWWYGRKAFKSLIRVFETHKTKDNTITFRMTRNISVTHPELAPYFYVTWKLVDNMSYNEFKQLINYKNCFSDVRIERDGENFVIRLKGINGIKEITAVPVKINKNNYKIKGYSQKVTNRMYKMYSRMLAYREKQFNKALVKGQLADNREYVKASEMPAYAWNKSKSLMNVQEKQLAFDQWRDYVKEQQKDEIASISYSASNSTNITRSFSIDGMGVWNCDQIQRLKNPVQVMAAYTNEKGEPINATATFIIDKNLNGVLQYYNNQIAFSKTAETVLIAIKNDGNIAVALPEYFKGKTFSDNKSYTFPLKELTAGTTSIQELKKIIGL